MTPRPLPTLVTIGLTGVALTLAGCTSSPTATTDTSSSAPGAVTVSSTDTECTLSATSAPSGTLSFDVANTGEQVTEFYLLAEDGEHVVGEVEDIGPGQHRRLVVETAPGRYVTACKPGMVGEGIRATFTVTGSGSG